MKQTLSGEMSVERCQLTTRNAVTTPSDEAIMQKVGSIRRRFVSLAMGVSLCAVLPDLAAAATVTIGDLTDNLSVSSSEFSALLAITDEAPGVLGKVNAHFDFLSTDPLAAGVTKTTNYNIFGPSGGLSDTLNIVVTGHTPTADDNTNVTVDMHFFSDTADENVSLLVLLANGIPITETGLLQEVNGGIADLTVQFTSDVSDADVSATPIPAALPLFATGLGVMGLLGWRRKRKAAALAA
jgi:hypothetical protein